MFKININDLSKAGKAIAEDFVKDLNKDFNKMQKEMTDDFKDAFKDFPNFSALFSELQSNIYKNKTSSFIEISLPGISKEEMVINLTGMELEVVVTEKFLRYKDEDVNSRNYTSLQWKRSKGSAKFELTEDYDLTKITSDLKDGVLTIEVPFKTKEKQETKTITIN